VKRIIVLPLLLIGLAGCEVLPGHKESAKAPSEFDAGPPPAVKPEDVTAANAQKSLKQLEQEIRYAERQP